MKSLRFRSSIPSKARARVVRRHPSGTAAHVEYLLGRSVVGYRDFDEDGALLFDCGLRRGKRHGREYRLDVPGKLLSATAYRHGREHGLARQWSDDGRLVGTYRMRNGSGVDLWWQETLRKPRRTYLAEVRFMRNGGRHGFEWWLNEDQRSVFQERHWSNDALHGIERDWEKATLQPGFPKFYLHGMRVTKPVSIRAQSQDPSLPPYRTEDDRPQRRFPPVVSRRLAFGVTSPVRGAPPATR